MKESTGLRLLGLVKPFLSTLFSVFLKKALNTRDRVAGHRSLPTSYCVFCGKVPESIEHLFFSCEFSLRIWTRILKLNRLRYSYSMQWNHILNWLCAHLSKTKKEKMPTMLPSPSESHRLKDLADRKRCPEDDLI